MIKVRTLLIVHVIALLFAWAIPANAQDWSTYPATSDGIDYWSGSWSTTALDEAEGGSLTWSVDPGASFNVRFQGAGIEVLYSTGPEGSMFSAQLLNADLVEVAAQQGNSFSAQYTYKNSMTFSELPEGQHTLVVTNGEGAIWIEAFRVQGTLIDLETGTAIPAANTPDSTSPAADNPLPEPISYSVVKLDETGYIVDWSSDSQSIAFYSYLNQDGDLNVGLPVSSVVYEVDVDGSNLRQLTSLSDVVLFQGSRNHQVWSPDGQRIALSSNHDVYILDVNNGNLTDVTDGLRQAYFGGWSSDGQTLAVGTFSGVYLVDVNTLIPVQLADGVSNSRGFLRMAPDGHWIAFGSDHEGRSEVEVYVVNTNGSNTQPINLTNNEVSDAFGGWSPDGQRIAFLYDTSGSIDLVMMDADGSNVTHLASSVGLVRGFGFGAWSPNGRYIAFHSSDPTPLSGANSAINVVDVNNLNITQITEYAEDTSFAGWSPDGQWIVGTWIREGATGSFVVDISGSSVIQLTDPTNNNEPIIVDRWSPDGQRIAGTNRSRELFIITLD